MKSVILALACVIVAAQAQYKRAAAGANAFANFGFPQNQYNRNQNQFQRNNYQRNPYNQNRFGYQQPQYNPFSTPAPPARPVVVVDPAPVVPVSPYVRVSADARSANILKAGNEINPDGSYNYYYETENGIAAQEQGSPRNFGGNPPAVADVAQGSFSWTSPEGQVIAITYVADENGYQPSGAAIPTPPPVPPQIARALEFIRLKSGQK